MTPRPSPAGILARLARCAKASSAVEFALVAPVFLAAMTGIMECCRLLFITQAANFIAFNAARCEAIGTDCTSTATTQTFVTTLAANYTLTYVANSFSTNTSTTCQGLSNSVSVTFTVTYADISANLIPALPATYTATGCFLKAS